MASPRPQTAGLLMRPHPCARGPRSPNFSQRSLFFALSLLFSVGIACGPGGADAGEKTLSRPPRPAHRAPDGDLLALVPDGAQVILSVDLEVLRRVHQVLAARQKGHGVQGKPAGSAIPGARHLPGALGSDVLRHAKVLTLALWLDDGPRGQILLLARGPTPSGPPASKRSRSKGAASREYASSENTSNGNTSNGNTSNGNTSNGSSSSGNDGASATRPAESPAHFGLGAFVKERLRSGIAGDEVGKPPSEGAPVHELRWERYRDVDLATYGAEATAIVTSRTVVSGPLPLVKHAIDLFREVPGFASVREDRAMMALWTLVTGPRAGRAPALAAVARFPDSTRQRMTTRLGLAAPPHRGGLRLSLGEWLTLRAFLDCPDGKSAEALIGGLQRAVQAAARSKLVTGLGLAPLLDLLAVHQEGGRVHGQWHAPLAMAAPHLARLTRLLGSLKAPGPERKNP